MAGEMLKVMSGIDMLHVPFKGAAPAIVALMGGEVDMAILDAPALLPQIRAGKMRVLAVASERRSRVLPQVPTMAESGMPGYHASSWHVTGNSPALLHVVNFSDQSAADLPRTTLSSSAASAHAPG